jgi:hypothetical protein
MPLTTQDEMEILLRMAKIKKELMKIEELIGDQGKSKTGEYSV